MTDGYRWSSVHFMRPGWDGDANIADKFRVRQSEKVSASIIFQALELLKLVGDDEVYNAVNALFDVAVERPSECSTAAETTFVNDVLDVERWGDRLVETRTDRDATIRPEHLVELQGETSTLDYGDWGRTIPRHC